MLLKQILYLAYLHAIGWPLFLGLCLFGWKKSVVETNLHFLGLRSPFLFRIRFYRNLVLDLLKVVHGYYGSPILVRNQDQPKLVRLRSAPALFLSAHFHNWEWMGSWLSNEIKVPLLSVALPFKGPFSNWMLKTLRQHLRISVIESEVTRNALRHVQSGKCLGMIWDQYPAAGQLEARFFSIELRVDPLPGFLAEKTLAPVYFGALLPQGQFRLVQLSHPGRVPLSAAKLARRYHRVLELLIRRYPDYWYGLTHRRFKDQILYELSRSVSRETTSSIPASVSRET